MPESLAELLLPPDFAGARLFCHQKGDLLSVCQVYSELLWQILNNIKHLSSIMNRAPCHTAPGLDAAGDTTLGHHHPQLVRVWDVTTPISSSLCLTLRDDPDLNFHSPRR